MLRPSFLPVAVCLALPLAVLVAAPGASAECFEERTHSYFWGPSAGWETEPFGDGLTLAGVYAYDTMQQDCDGDGIRDPDGVLDAGFGGGFFGFGPWADEAICNYGFRSHGGTVEVLDHVHGPNIHFYVGADDTNGPALKTDPVTGATVCETSGAITPGDPAVDPLADADDCLSPLYVHVGTTCGAGGDGGYWVILMEVVQESSQQVLVSNPPVQGTITA